MSGYQLAWALYALGGLGCGLSAWLLFRRFGREWGHFFMVTVWVLLLTPYALDKESMLLAPAVFVYVMEGSANGFDSVKSVALVLAGAWLLALVLSLVFQLLTRPRRDSTAARPPKAASADLDPEEQQARDALLEGDIPLRAER